MAKTGQRIVDCEVKHNGYGWIPLEEQQANARLIAAAPELLEALEKLSELMSMSDAAFTSVNVNAKKAIKKARFG